MTKFLASDARERVPDTPPRFPFACSRASQDLRSTTMKHEWRGQISSYAESTNESLTECLGEVKVVSTLAGRSARRRHGRGRQSQLFVSHPDVLTSHNLSPGKGSIFVQHECPCLASSSQLSLRLLRALKGRRVVKASYFVVVMRSQGPQGLTRDSRGLGAPNHAAIAT